MKLFSHNFLSNVSFFFRMIKVLNVEPTDFSKTLIDMANSFIEYGLVKL